MNAVMGSRLPMFVPARATPAPLGKNIHPAAFPITQLTRSAAYQQASEDSDETEEGGPAEETSDDPAVEELTTNEDGFVVFPTITETVWDTETTETMTTTFVEEQETIVEDRKCPILRPLNSTLGA